MMHPRISKRVIESDPDGSEIVEFLFYTKKANCKIIGEINSSLDTLTIYDMDSFPTRNGAGRRLLKILSSNYTLIVATSAPGANHFWKKMVQEGTVSKVEKYCKGVCQ